LNIIADVSVGILNFSLSAKAASFEDGSLNRYGTDLRFSTTSRVTRLWQLRVNIWKTFISLDLPHTGPKTEVD
jgi:hypothetical protein